MNCILSVEGICKEFGGKKVVDDISFQVSKGEILGILGPNGAGKSTTIRSIMGIIYPDSGNIDFRIECANNTIPIDKIGYLPEERGLYKNVRIIDILMYLADLKNYPKNKAKKRIFEYLEKFDLKGKEKAKIEELSKGMAQKVQFIAAVLHEPEILILDEPFSGLDPVSQDVFREEIINLAKGGTSILLSSHQMNLVEALCNRIFLIHQGKKVIYGNLDEIKESFANFKCTINGSFNGIDLLNFPYVDKVEGDEGKKTVYFKPDASINTFINEISNHMEIKELHIDRISLHDIFVRIAKGGIPNE
ncbi:ABC transporter ATP-binding protein [Alkaliphilus peptidifermentans]|uniref:ABC-2 type transport system ATP-binding protein n=1 Tax=Alkaliphilus peptidifermentans DSM 18978 TaxID=1120976 RepID=A0A1G5F416_9FIRM|nr:ATP-binding cassette domain-containing protein [Alkaliphilus peptidifermentans]SCY33851.1 ABC-2 type transport system ATP-binding protein [Alkaliphilus peptidifermentans DSM 18978]